MLLTRLLFFYLFLFFRLRARKFAAAIMLAVNAVSGAQLYAFNVAVALFEVGRQPFYVVGLQLQTYLVKQLTVFVGGNRQSGGNKPISVGLRIAKGVAQPHIKTLRTTRAALFFAL